MLGQSWGSVTDLITQDAVGKASRDAELNQPAVAPNQGLCGLGVRMRDGCRRQHDRLRCIQHLVVQLQPFDAAADSSLQMRALRLHLQASQLIG